MLIVFGLAISIPLIVAGATLIMALLTRFPILVWAGAGLLGWIAGELMVEDPGQLGPTSTRLAAAYGIIAQQALRSYGMHVGCTLLVLGVGWLLCGGAAAVPSACPVRKAARPNSRRWPSDDQCEWPRSSPGPCSFWSRVVPAASIAEPGLEWTLRQRHQEPSLEHEEKRDRHDEPTPSALNGFSRPITIMKQR